MVPPVAYAQVVSGCTPLPWAHPTMLAPMEGVTNPTVRAVMAERGGVGIVCTEFVRVSRSPISPGTLRRAVVKAPGVPLSVQVMGRDADKMADAAAVVADAGADVVDVNLGCPTPRAVRKGVGAALLKDPELLFEVLSAMRARVEGLFSAKIRAGFDDASHAVAIAEAVERAGADYIVVHPRRRADFYRGVADWRIVRALKERLSIPVVGNGDVWYAADALRLERETGCDGVMIGRPALRNPFIFRQIADLRAGREPERPSGVALFEHLLTLSGRLEQRHAEPVGRIKEQLRWIGRALGDDLSFVHRAVRLTELGEILRLAERELATLPPERLDLDAYGTLGFERSGSGLEGARPRVSDRGAPVLVSSGR